MSTNPYNRPRGRPKKTPPPSLDKHLAALRALGVTIEAPLSEKAERLKKVAEIFLGMRAENEVEPQAPTKSPGTLEGTLRFQHSIAGRVFGPGPLTLDASESDLFRSLLQADQQAQEAIKDTTEYQYDSRCYIIQQVRGEAGRRFRKVEVSEATFNSGAFYSLPSLTVSMRDAL